MVCFETLLEINYTSIFLHAACWLCRSICVQLYPNLIKSWKALRGDIPLLSFVFLKIDTVSLFTSSLLTVFCCRGSGLVQ